jgi:hypothetical protein
VLLCEADAFCTLGSEMSKRAVSDKSGGLDAIETAAMEAALSRCRALVRQIQSKLRNKRPEHFVDKLSLADFCASVEKAADVLNRSVVSRPQQICSRRDRQQSTRARAVHGCEAGRVETPMP